MNGSIAYRSQRNPDGRQTTQPENPPADVDPESIIFQPFVHEVPGQRRRYQKCQRDEQDKFSGKQIYDAGNRSPKYFSDSYFFSPLNRP